MFQMVWTWITGKGQLERAVSSPSHSLPPQLPFQLEGRWATRAAKIQSIRTALRKRNNSSRLDVPLSGNYEVSL